LWKGIERGEKGKFQRRDLKRISLRRDRTHLLFEGLEKLKSIKRFLKRKRDVKQHSI